MGNGISLISSGFSLIDDKWGGIYRGGSYMVVGPRKSGRTLLALQFAKEAAEQGETCLYFTNMRPKDLMIQAASLQFDIQAAMNQNSVIVVRVAPPSEIYEMHNPDDYLIEYLNDIITVVNQYHPNRVIFDELTPYIGFRNLDLLRDVFLHTLETIEDRNITSFFVVGEPATQKAQQIVDILTNTVTGNILLKKYADKIGGRFHGGTVVIVPNVGHTEGQFSSEYRIEPHKGIAIEMTSDDVEKELPPSKPAEVNHSHKNNGGFVPTTPAIQKPKEEELVFSNIYNYSDFQLILNNQIALYKSTGQVFNVVSFMLDPAAQVKGLLSLNQLQNAISLSTFKRDKICVVDNKIIVLLVRSSRENVLELNDRMKGNLPSDDTAYVNAVSDYISLAAIEVDEHFNGADEILNPLIKQSAPAKYIGFGEFN